MILEPTPQNIAKCAACLREGQVVAFPTETVYGLGADATSDSAVQKIFDHKGRPANNPLIVHLPSATEVMNFCAYSLNSQTVARLEKLSTLWPGPLSIIVSKPAQISDKTTAHGTTVAFRVPSHPVARELLEQVNIPIAAPSANKSFYVSPTSAAHVEEDFQGAIPVLNGGCCAIGLESTVVDITKEHVIALRLGAITLEHLQKILPQECVVHAQIKVDPEKSSPISSPGLFGKHYSPSTPVSLLSNFTASEGIRIGFLAFSHATAQRYAANFAEVIYASRNGDLNEVARQLYSKLRELDLLGLDLIISDTCEPTGIGAAIMDRLQRASAN